MKTKKKNIEDLEIGDEVIGIKIKGFEDTNDVDKLYQWRQDGDLETEEVITTVVDIEPIEVDEVININEGTLEATESHSQLVSRNGRWQFMPLENVKIGDLIQLKGGIDVEVFSVEREKRDVTVYELTLEHPVHTMYANNIITHNIK